MEGDKGTMREQLIRSTGVELYAFYGKFWMFDSKLISEDTMNCHCNAKPFTDRLVQIKVELS